MALQVCQFTLYRNMRQKFIVFNEVFDPQHHFINCKGAVGIPDTKISDHFQLQRSQSAPARR